MFYRSGILGDPLVSLSNKDIDCLNAALSTGWYSPMLAAQFEGLSIWIRQSLGVENENCLNAVVTSCIKPTKTTEFKTIVMPYSTNAFEEIPNETRLSMLLRGCTYSSCLLKELGCTLASTSSRIQILTISPWTISAMTDANTAWEEWICLECTWTGGVMQLDSIKFK